VAQQAPAELAGLRSTCSPPISLAGLLRCSALALAGSRQAQVPADLAELFAFRQVAMDESEAAV